MGYDTFWDEYQLFFHHEFINEESFPDEKKALLQNEMGSYFINKDFTIYQEKTKPFDRINEADFKNNYLGFIRILLNILPNKVEDLLNFHFEKFHGKKEEFLTFVYHQIKGSKTTQGDKVLPVPQNKLILFKWCEEKMNNLEIYNHKNTGNSVLINKIRIEEIKKLESGKFDFRKLIKLLEEINDNYSIGNYFAVSALSRAVVDHIPPIFEKENFEQVANNYGGSSIKKSFRRLNESMKVIADIHLHGQIRKKEGLPNVNQIDFGPELDLLLGEIISRIE
ncbi:MAG: hypothetical protein JJ876_00150 [Muricauda sp.]|nr:hypothetical protein [Allomuricauda sp.]MBO6827949.1 hypothetical protein [Allomuricauda sp.]